MLGGAAFGNGELLRISGREITKQTGLGLATKGLSQYLNPRVDSSGSICIDRQETSTAGPWVYQGAVWAGDALQWSLPTSPVAESSKFTKLWHLGYTMYAPRVLLQKLAANRNCGDMSVSGHTVEVLLLWLGLMDLLHSQTAADVYRWVWEKYIGVGKKILEKKATPMVPGGKSWRSEFEPIFFPGGTGLTGLVDDFRHNVLNHGRGVTAVPGPHLGARRAIEAANTYRDQLKTVVYEHERKFANPQVQKQALKDAGVADKEQAEEIVYGLWGWGKIACGFRWWRIIIVHQLQEKEVVLSS